MYGCWNFDGGNVQKVQKIKRPNLKLKKKKKRIFINFLYFILILNYKLCVYLILKLFNTHFYILNLYYLQKNLDLE